MSNSRYVVGLVLLAAMPDTGSAQPKPPPPGGKVTEEIKDLDLAVPLKVGDGFELGGYQRRPSPFANPIAVPDGGRPGSKLELFWVTSSTGLDEVTGFEMRVSVRTPFGGGGGGNKRKAGVRITEGQVHLVIVAEHSYGADSLPNDAQLTPAAQALLKGNPKEFAELYGTHFVKSQQRVSRVVYVLTTNRWSEKTTKLSKTEAQADGGFAGWGGGTSLSMMEDLKREEVRNTLTVKAYVTGGDEGFKTLADVVRAAVLISDTGSINKNVGDAIARTFTGHNRGNSGAGAMVLHSYRTVGWNPVLALLWSDEYEEKLKECAKLVAEAEALLEAIDATRKDLGIPIPTRNKLEALSGKYADYLKELKARGRELIGKNAAALKAKPPAPPRPDLETEAVLFKRYAGFLERLERVEREKNDEIEIITRKITSTTGAILERNRTNEPMDQPGKEQFTFKKKHSRYEAFVTDVDLTYPVAGDHSEIQSARMTAKVLDFKPPTDTVQVEYRLFVKSEPKRIAFKGTAKLIVIGY